MFKISLENPDILRNSIGIISEILDEGVFKVDNNGISLLSPDRTMVAVVDFKILSTAFEEYDVQAPVDLGLNLSNLIGVLKRVKGSDKLTLQLTPKNKLEVIIEGNGKRRFELPLLEIKTEKPPIEQLDFSSKIDIDSNVLEQGIGDAETVGDSIIFESKPDVFKLYGKGDTTSSELELKKGDAGLLSIVVNEGGKSRYSLDYLKKMIKACKLVKQVSVGFGNDYPLRLAFKEVDKMNLNFVLAPRVSDD